MRKLKIIEHISLDGVIQSGGDTDSGFPYGDWTGPYRSPAGLTLLLAEYGERVDLLLGRRTYDSLGAFWPTAPGGPMADRMNGATKFVLTHRPDTLSWGPAVGVASLEDVRVLKASDGPDLVTVGSSTLTSKLIEQGLADEVLLMVNPVLLGQGKRLFAEGTPARSLILERSQTTPTGIVINAYKVAKPL